MRYDRTRNSWLVSRTGCAVDGDPRRSRVERDWPAAQLGADPAGGAANQCAQARQHFFDAEWLGDVVVGAAVDALDLLVPASRAR